MNIIMKTLVSRTHRRTKTFVLFYTIKSLNTYIRYIQSPLIPNSYIGSIHWT